MGEAASSEVSTSPEAVAARLADEAATVSAQLARMEQDLTDLFAASRDDNADDEHDPEGQTIAYERSQLSAMISRARTNLAEVEAAVERLSAGTYGTCAVCGQPIGAVRLEAKPAARTCVRHADVRP
jgi:RNA polymerase-binding transcription factor DksA